MRSLYRLLLKLYPARFREEFAAPLETQFADEYRDTEGTGARAMLWLRTFADLAITVPRELLRELRQDVRYSARLYRRRAFSTSLALIALALAIGASTGVFSVVNALLLRSLPFRAPEQLVLVPNFHLPKQLVPTPLDGPRAPFYRWRNSAGFLEDAATYRLAEMNLNTGRGAMRVDIAETSGNFFAMLGTSPVIGRAFDADEDVRGRGHIAVISHGLWQQFFGANPQVLGSTIRLQGVPLTVVGVAPPGFDYPGNVSVWTPTIFDTELLILPIKSMFGNVVGRLKPGLSLAAADRIFDMEERRAAGPDHKIEHQALQPLRDQLAGPVRQASLVLLGAVLLVLLIACANVAQLLLSRITDRRAELTVRAALGASRARRVQQLATESVVLTLAAACAGLAVARWTVGLASLVLPAQLAAQQYTILDGRVLAFAVGLAILTGLIFGIVPACLMGRLLADQPLQSGVGTPREVRRLRALVVSVQAAVAIVLLAGSLTLGRSFLKLLSLDLGYRVDHVVTLSVSLSGTRYQTDWMAAGTAQRPPQLRELPYYHQALERLRTLPGVESAAAVEYVPLVKEILVSESFTFDSGQEGNAMLVGATPDYFRSIGTPLLEGRDFTAADRQGTGRVAIVSESFARKIANGANVLGRKVTPAEDEPLTIVGVVGKLRYDPLRNLVRDTQVYTPIDQSAPSAATFTVRVHGNPETYLPILRDSLRQVDPDVAVYGVSTFDRRRQDSLARPRFYTTAVVFFAAFALLLAVIGVYGAASYSLAQRTHEIGIRTAVGASPARLRGMLLREHMMPVAVGVLAGVAGAMAMGRLLQSLIATAEPVGNGTSAMAAAALALASGIAVWSATRRIVKMDPLAALRSE